MTVSSPRMQWPYPTREDDPWYEFFQDYINSADASGFAAREDRSIIWAGGGTVSWDLASETLEWTGEIDVYSPIGSRLLQIDAGSIADLAEGEVVYVVLTRQPLENISATLVKASQLPSNDNAMSLAVRIGDVIYFRTGISLGDGDTADGIAPVPGGAGLEVEDEGVSVDPAVSKMDFVGGNITATQTAPGEVQVAVTGGVASPFEDDIPNNEIQPVAASIGRSFIVGSQDMDDSGVANDARMFFNKTKAAFRAGEATGNEWNDVDVGTNSIALGRNCRASGDRSVALVQSSATGLSSFAAGGSARAQGEYTVALVGGQAAGNYSVAEGYSRAGGLTSHAEGYARAEGDLSHAEGYAEANGQASHAEGTGGYADGDWSHAEGFESIARDQACHAEGYDTLAEDVNSAFDYGGSHSEGVFTEATYEAAHAEGYWTDANAKWSHTEGYTTSTGAAGSHAEGIGSSTSGNPTSYNNGGAHAEGYQTSASGPRGAHSEGRFSTASGTASHAEGNSTIASGNNSHAEGSQADALGDNSHAEGYFTTATAVNSHAEGEDSESYFEGSHAASSGLVSFSDRTQYQRVTVGRRLTPDPLWHPLTLGGSSPSPATSLVVPLDHSWSVAIEVTARDGDPAFGGGGTGDTATFFFKAAVKNVAGVVTFVGGVSPWTWLHSFKDPGAALWDARIVIGTTVPGAMEIEALGDISRSTIWEATVHLTEVATPGLLVDT